VEVPDHAPLLTPDAARVLVRILHAAARTQAAKSQITPSGEEPEALAS
jgi:hypothetical protein